MPPRPRHLRSRRHDDRRGTIVLLVAASLLTVLACAALVVDRAWVRFAHDELRATTEAAAVAAARALVTDETLQPSPNWTAITERAENVAATLAASNRVAGRPIELRTGDEGDVRFGVRVLDRDTGTERLVFTDNRPTTVLVTTERTRERTNPVATLLSGAFGVAAADVSARGSATIDNHVLGLQTLAEIPVPALPIAIRESNDANQLDDGWNENVEGPAGRDEYGWDPVTRSVVRRPDGLPEITLRTLSSADFPITPNVQLVDFANGFIFDRLTSQITRGLEDGDLADWNGAIRLDGNTVTARCSAPFDDVVVRALEEAVGQPRLCFLFANHVWEGDRGDGRLDLVRLVAVRILDVRYGDFGAAEIVVQPTVVATKTAILDENWRWNEDDDAPRNPHVYGIRLDR